MEENLTPYQKVALEALQKHKEKSYEEALEMVKRMTIGELEEEEEKWGVAESITAGTKSLAAYVTEAHVRKKVPTGQLENIIFGNPSQEEVEQLRADILEGMRRSGVSTDEAIIRALRDIHTSWIKDAETKGKFFSKDRKNRRYQFLPIEFIGYDELSKDLDFIRPILEILGIEYSEEGLREAYRDQVERSFSIRQIQDRTENGVEFFRRPENEEDIVSMIQRTDLEGETRSANSLSRQEQQKREVAEEIARQVIDKNPIILEMLKKNKEVNKSIAKDSDKIDQKENKQTSWKKVKEFIKKAVKGKAQNSPVSNGEASMGNTKGTNNRNNSAREEFVKSLQNGVRNIDGTIARKLAEGEERTGGNPEIAKDNQQSL